MSAPLQVPVGELTSLGIGKETTFATFATPTLFHAIEDWTATPKNLFIPRTGARKRIGQNLPVAGGFEGKASVTPEADPDTLGQLLAFALGAQTTPALTASSTTAYGSTLTFGTLPSFSVELNYGTDAIDYLGCMIESYTLSIQKGKGLVPKFNIVYADEAPQAAPSSPTYSTKMPPAFENPNNTVSIAGTAMGVSGEITVHQLDISVTNNLDPNYRSFGNGRKVVTFPQQQRKVTGKVQLGFESDLLRQKFWGGNTGPNSASVPGIPLDFLMCTQDLAGTSIPYSFEFILGNVFITDYGTPVKAGQLIMQEFSFEAAETANGANDDIAIKLVNTNSTKY